jgi:Fe-S cluster biogenesis protein NfuA/nitrite reductase/ring-hydroxylating ferredoxin subunit
MASAVAASPGSKLDQLAERADRALADVRALPKEAQTTALALKAALDDLYKLGLTRIVQRLKEDGRGKELLFDLVDDPAVYALLTMHGIVREDLRAQASRVLETVRPYMQSHGGDVELVDVTQNTVFVRLAGSCNGCSLSAVTLRGTVEEAFREHMPQIQSVEVVPNEPEPKAGFVPLDTLSAPPKPEPGWAVGPSASTVMEAEPFRWDVEGTSIVLVRFRNRLQAYRNECAHLGMALDGGHIDPETGVLTCPWHGFRYNCSNGECLTVPQAQLEALPLRVENGRILVRIAS